MRDTQKMKDKLELSLEGRHLVSLSVVGLVGLGAAFWLGIAVGKKLQREEVVAPQPDLLAALDANAEAQKPNAPASPLTFQEELTKKHPVLVIEKPVVKPALSPSNGAPERPAEAVPAGPPKPGDKFVEAISERVVVLKPEVQLDIEVKPPPMPPSVQRPVPAETLVATRTNDDAGALRDAIARASRPAQTSPDGNWTLQLSAYQDRGEADRYLAGLRDRGYAPYIIEAQIPNRGTWYRVRMGRFASREAATHYLGDFQRETQIKAIVTSVQ